MIFKLILTISCAIFIYIPTSFLHSVWEHKNKCSEQVGVEALAGTQPAKALTLLRGVDGSIEFCGVTFPTCFYIPHQRVDRFHERPLFYTNIVMKPVISLLF